MKDPFIEKFSNQYAVLNIAANISMDPIRPNYIYITSVFDVTKKHIDVLREMGEKERLYKHRIYSISFYHDLPFCFNNLEQSYKTTKHYWENYCQIVDYKQWQKERLLNKIT